MAGNLAPRRSGPEPNPNPFGVRLKKTNWQAKRENLTGEATATAAQDQLPPAAWQQKSKGKSLRNSKAAQDKAAEKAAREAADAKAAEEAIKAAATAAEEAAKAAAKAAEEAAAEVVRMIAEEAASRAEVAREAASRADAAAAAEVAAEERAAMVEAQVAAAEQAKQAAAAARASAEAAAAAKAAEAKEAAATAAAHIASAECAAAVRAARAAVATRAEADAAKAADALEAWEAEQEAARPRVKAVVVGARGSGKTTLIRTFAAVHDHHQPKADMVAPADEVEVLEVLDGLEVRLHVRDTDGQADPHLARYEDAEAREGSPAWEGDAASVVLLCFPLDSTPREMIEQALLRFWLPEFRVRAPNVPWMLVGTKLDQRHDEAITAAEGHAIAQRAGAKAYVECCGLEALHRVAHCPAALRAEVVQAVLHDAIRVALRYPPKPPDPGCVLL